ncbi:MAG: alkylation response protein AidB-like acyl-CoA dehydrogenase [Paracoccaceae bacterium]|jgi:alkylation response protein AidB-like acyl-CoA dehydrogenase
MDFNHTEERQMLAETLSRYTLQDYPMDARLTAGASETGFSPSKWAELAELGVVGALFSEDDGGFGGAGHDLAVVFEAIGHGLICEPFLQSGIFAGGILALAGSDDQKSRIDALISGEVIGTLAHFEADDGCDTAYIETAGVQAGDGWVLNGHKAVVRHGAAADFMIVSARTEGQVGDAGGISLFMVPKGAAGVELQTYQTIDGGGAADVNLVDVKLGPEALIGQAGQAYETLENALGRGLLALCAEALGIMDAVKDMTIEYIQTRQQFGVPIGKFQALQHRMAEMLLEIEQARSAVINAAALVDGSGVIRERALSAAKVTIGRVGTLVAEESIQLHGGIGMTWEHSLGHFAKRLIVIGHELGDDDYHLNRYMKLGAA